MLGGWPLKKKVAAISIEESAEGISQLLSEPPTENSLPVEVNPKFSSVNTPLRWSELVDMNAKNGPLDVDAEIPNPIVANKPNTTVPLNQGSSSTREEMEGEWLVDGEKQSINGLTKLASAIGVPLHIDKCIAYKDRIAYARVLIQVYVLSHRLTLSLFVIHLGRSLIRWCILNGYRSSVINEIKAALFSIDDGKTPRLDGYSAGFYKHACLGYYWH
ncbi:hypothetical protein Cgig2_030775 [Carnegiea gigantea]|uniref:Uncharacterized protein n=1 Tax=Carnegiea gigantea TaxID=171969 RepID=A0A9Q1QP23_9CARY|nr:hypothetical protein Cgig2_030775 [Carnegiea gigantea]